MTPARARSAAGGRVLGCPGRRRSAKVRRHAQGLRLHLRVGERRPSRQGLRPDLRRHPRRAARPGPRQPRRVRVAHQDGPRGGRGRDHHQRQGRVRRDRQARDPRHRLHVARDGLQLRQLRGRRRGRAAVARHLAGRHRGRGPVQGAGRRRPGHDVRLRLRRDEGVHAVRHLHRAPHRPAARRGAQVGPAARSCCPTASARCRSSTATARPMRAKTVVVSSQHRADVSHEHAQGGDHRGGGEEGRAAGVPRQGDGLPHQPDRQVRRRRPAGRLRAHRPQDHRRHLRRLRPARRRRLLRQGPEQGRPQRRLLRALRREERRGGRARARAARCRWRTRSASPTRSRSWSTRSAPASCRTSKIATLVRELFDFKPASLIQHARAEAADLPAHGGRTATSAAWPTGRTSPGSAPTASTTCAARPGWASARSRPLRDRPQRRATGWTMSPGPTAASACSMASSA